MKKKVLFFIESLAGGGAEQVLVTMLRHFNYDRYDVTLLTFSDCGVHLDDIDFNKVHYMTVNRSHTGFFGRLWDILKYRLLYYWLPASVVAKLIIPKGFDTYIAFVEGYTTKIISKLYSINNRLSSINLLTWVHIDLKNYPWTLQRGVYQSLEEEIAAYKRFNKAICVSRSVEEIMKSYYGLTNTITIYNPIDVEFINQKAQELIDFTPLEGFNLVTVGRLVPQKGYDLLIPIIARLRNEGINVNLYILGDGEDFQNLRDISLELKVEDNVKFLGFKKNPHTYVSKCDCFVCSSRAEGYSLVIAEALSMGIPVISTNCSGPNELLDGGKYGILCIDYQQLYAQIKDVVTNKGRQKELHEKALKRREILGVENTLNQLYTIL